MNDFIMSDGHRFTVIVIAVLKRVLQDAPMKAGERLRLLEKINGMVDLWLTAEMLAMIGPASDAEDAMVDAARSLDPKEHKPDDPLPPSVYMLMRSDVFEHFRKLNAGIAAAVEYARSRDARFAA